MAPRNSQDFAFCRRGDVDAFLDGRFGLAHRPGAGEQGVALELMELRFKRRSSRLLDRLQPGGDRRKRRFGLADRQLRIGLQRQQVLKQPRSVALYPLCDLGESLLAFAGDGERPSVLAKGKCVILRDAVLLEDAQRPSSIVGGRQWVAAKDVDERGETQCLSEGQRVVERLGTSDRCSQLIEGPVRVTQHPANERREGLACHARVGTGPIAKTHVRIEELEAPPKLRMRRLEFSLPVQRQAERRVRPDETGGIAEPFGDAQRLLSKMQRFLQLE
jgi:hypothetical protein